MRDFFRSRTFIAMCVIAVLLLAMMIVSATDSGRVTVLEDAVGVIITPIQSLVTTVSEKSGDLAAVFTEHKQLVEENERLKTELAAAGQALRDAQEYKLENESLRGALGIKEDHADFIFEPAQVVASDLTDHTHVITLNKGSLSSVKKRDVVMTKQGLVGYVTEVGATWCRAITLLDSGCEIGATVPRTQDIGVTEGDYLLAADGKCKLSYLENDVQLNSGDSVVTSGIDGVFPARIFIGNVAEVKPEPHGISQYAVVEPAVDVTAVRNVFIITSFSAAEGGADTADGDNG